MSAASPPDLPTVVAHIGATLAEVRDRSTFALNLSRVTDSNFNAVTKPCRFTYDGPGGFALPPTTFVTFVSEAAIIENIEVSPHLEPLPLEAAIALVGQLRATIQAAGWTRWFAGMVSIEELRVSVRDPGGADQVRWPCARLDRGTIHLVLSVKRLERASVLKGLFGGSDAFLVNVEINDLDLTLRLGKVRRALRPADDKDGRRPIELDAYLARAVPLLEVTPESR